MGEFVQEYAVLRWGIVAAFVLTATIVAGRLAAVAGGRAVVAEGAGVVPVADRESDAAHLLMCLVMLAMLVFPALAAPGALRGVLTAMLVVYAAVLAGRIARWRGGDRAAAGGCAVIGYHIVAAAAMLWTVSGGMRMGAMPMTGTGVHSGPGAAMLVLAALFALDAVLMILPGRASPLRHVLGHSGSPAVVLPHVVMDLGTTYMLVAAALN
ncbi:DUF5134 domain-containing protein [Nocardia alni]|uniref:DUF5134 domain-containing protein n=1 Tax=Nocardia alni TaxID=2815723 RepID=UPI001C23A3A2|nr:DUF5134 domain-containing protein [Nocardia alni]